MRTTRLAWKALLAAVASLGLLCVTAGAAGAAPASPTLASHATVLTADPAIGSTIAQAPAQVTVFTAENINPDPTKSNLQVYGPSAEATDSLISSTGNAQISLSNPKEMSISIKPNAGHTSGVYTIFWKTVSADDGDAASGSFTFTVNPAASSSTPTATATRPATTTASQSSSTASPGTPIWVPIISALLALLIGLGAGLGLGRRKQPASSIGALRASVVQEGSKGFNSKADRGQEVK
jgi:copper transport protein